MKQENEGVDLIVIGRLLKAAREENGNTQLDIATHLGYRNVNFIYLIEQGRSNIPLGKMLAIIQAYKIDRLFGLAIVKNLHPNVWELFLEMTQKNYTDMKDMGKFEEKVEAAYVKKIKEHKLEALKNA